MDLVSTAHAVAATTALALALTALRARKRRGTHTRAGRVYVVLMAPMLASGLVIGAADPAVSVFEVAVLPTAGPLALGTAALVRRPRRLLGRHWLTWHIGGMGGSVIGLVTAGLFQTAAPALPETTAVTTLLFAVPAIAGTLLIQRTIERRVPAPPVATGAPAQA